MDVAHVYALIDWNSQIHSAPSLRGASEELIARATLELVLKKLYSALTKINAHHRFKVKLRLYHGWRKGFELTLRRRALARVIQYEPIDEIFYAINFVVDREIEYGDDLFSADISRRHAKLGCHLPNTLRNSIKNPGLEEEKLVDTAIASDLISIAALMPENWIVLVGEDDDLIPPLFTAESFRQPSDAPIRLLRSRTATPFYKLEGLTC